MLYSELIPENLGIIFRKEYTDLRDSTVRDFERYTGLKVTSDRSVKLKNNSEILFRHIEEINNIQNINLGWFGIEQADELATSNEFFLLFGRLRRSIKPSDKFKEYGMSERSGFVIGNAGDHWGRELWKEGKLEDSECIEATTLQNIDVLPDDFIKSFDILKKQRPEIYAQFVMNDWNVTSDRYVLIKPSDLKALEGMFIHYPLSKYLVSVDPSMGGDECVIYVFENTKIVETLILHDKDLMKVTGHIQTLMYKHNIDDVAVDVIGIGAGIADRLAEQGRIVHRINSAERSGNSTKFLNRRAEMWWYASQEIQDKHVLYPEDELLRKQLTTIRYKVINSNGQIQMEHKADVKKRLGSSPDRADAWIYGIWALQYVEKRKTKEEKRRNRVEEYEFNPMTV